MRSLQRFGLSLAAILVYFCGCGGGGGNRALLPPMGLHYTAGTAAYTLGMAITANSPSSSGGAVTSYSVSPPLPPGLSLDSTTGVISGTPTATTSTVNFMVTASNATGSTTATLSITVGAAISYNPSSAVYTVGVAIPPNSPSGAGAAVTSYSVNPMLPTGLNLDGTTGTISGIPASVTPTASYTVTANLASGNATAILNITVISVATSVPNMGQQITPLLPTGAQFQQLDPGFTVNGQEWLAQDAATSVVSPDGKTMLVLTSGFNGVYDAGGESPLNFLPPQDSTEYVFIYDISAHIPVKKQVVGIPIATYHGIVFDPTSTSTNAHFNVSGCSADNVHTFSLNSATGI